MSKQAYNQIREGLEEALAMLGGATTAETLCRSLVSGGHDKKLSQLAIQRAAEDGSIVICKDWSLRLPEGWGGLTREGHDG